MESKTSTYLLCCLYYRKEYFMLKAILYCDGSAINPGAAGSGIHGYIFDSEQKPDKPYIDNGVIATDQGYNDYITEGMPVAPLSFINAYYSFDYESYPPERQTNNLGELMAIYYGVEICFTQGCMDILVFSDSTFCIDMCRNISAIHKRDYLKKDGTPYALKDSLHQVYLLLKSINDVGGNVSYKWIKGHKGYIGNEYADRLAYIGRQHTRQNCFSSNVEIKPFKEYKDLKSDRPDLICLPRLYFSTNREEYNPGEYLMAGYVTTKPDQFFLGKRSSDSIYAIYVANKSCKTIEDVVATHQNLEHRYTKLVRLELNTLFRKDNVNYYGRYGNYSLIPKYNKGYANINSLTGDAITVEEIPTCMSYKAIGVYRELSEVLGPFLREEELPKGIRLYDITDSLYIPDKKHMKLKPEYVNSSVAIPIDDPYINLYFRIDLPERNIMKRLEKKDVKVYFGEYRVIDKLHFTFTIISCVEGTMIWTNRYARRITDTVPANLL